MTKEIFIARINARPLHLTHIVPAEGHTLKGSFVMHIEAIRAIGTERMLLPDYWTLDIAADLFALKQLIITRFGKLYSQIATACTSIRVYAEKLCSADCECGDRYAGRP